MSDADEILNPIGPPDYHPVWDDVDPISGHYDRKGNLISMRDWVRLREFGGRDYITVKQEHVGDYWVSTVWLGIDHGYRMDADQEGYRPIIFETMVFRGKESDLDMKRYSTEAEALAGHEETVNEVRLLGGLNEAGTEAT